jgi:ABC-type polysaccharide/polyol phosphate transport system ATPase subunit
MHAILLDQLSKRYCQSARSVGAYRTLRESLAGGLKGRRQGPAPPFWALREVCLEVPAGQVLGLVGPNGAGKSTLLRVLAGITPPTEGRSILRGRVAGLLEVGAGFHLELSGRDNIYLGGAVLGMARREVARRFDDIVALAGLEQSLELPLKRYSSGMYLRLAFAVASARGSSASAPWRGPAGPSSLSRTTRL